MPRSLPSRRRNVEAPSAAAPGTAAREPDRRAAGVGAKIGWTTSMRTEEGQEPALITHYRSQTRPINFPARNVEISGLGRRITVSVPAKRGQQSHSEAAMRSKIG